MTKPNKTLLNDKGSSELVSRIMFLFFAILIYRIGTHIPIPGVSVELLQRELLNPQNGAGSSIFNLGNLFSGGAIQRMSLFSLGLMPYISASIVIQLLSHMPGKLKELRMTGSQGRKKINQYTRYVAFFVALFQGFALCTTFESSIALYTGPAFWVIGALSLAVGAMFLMWLGEQITDKGIGNGISMLIFAGICASLPSVLGGLFESAYKGDTSVPFALSILAILVSLFFLIVFIETTQRRIPIHYARQQAGMQSPSASNYLPLKINLAGVMPAIFASAIIMLIGLIFTTLAKASFVGSLMDGKIEFYINKVAAALTSGQPTYIILYGVLIIGFAFFYTGLMFENKELSEDLKRSGAFIQGIRPGKATADYIDLVQSRLTLIGAIYVAFVVLLPEVFNMNSSNKVLLMFGGTSLLIVVVVAMDFFTQIQSHLMSKQYQSLMKKSHLGRKRV